MEASAIQQIHIKFCRQLSVQDLSRLPFQKQIFVEIPNSILAHQAELQHLALRKLPADWLEKNLLLPDRQAIEQSSSVFLAQWKKQLVPDHVEVLADASAGLGVDAFHLGEKIPLLLVFETSLPRFQALKFNAPVIRSAATEIKCEGLQPEELVSLTQKGAAFFLYVDPDRRDSGGNRKTSWKDCQPDIREFHRIMKESGSHLMVKFSPLDDPEEIASELPEGLSNVWLLSLHNEVKEVLMYWNFGLSREEVSYEAVDIRHNGEHASVKIPLLASGSPEQGVPRPGAILLDPWASLRKSRFAACLAQERGWKQVSARARLFLADADPVHFPGRKFEILEMFQSLAAFRTAFKSNSCHVVSRDFPAEAEEIRKKLGLKEEGDFFLFCFQNKEKGRQILLVRRI